MIQPPSKQEQEQEVQTTTTRTLDNGLATLKARGLLYGPSLPIALACITHSNTSCNRTTSTARPSFIIVLAATLT
jgi:hypothetical protein